MRVRSAEEVWVFEEVWVLVFGGSLGKREGRREKNKRRRRSWAWACCGGGLEKKKRKQRRRREWAELGLLEKKRGMKGKGGKKEEEQ